MSSLWLMCSQLRVARMSGVLKGATFGLGLSREREGLSAEEAGVLLTAVARLRDDAWSRRCDRRSVRQSSTGGNREWLALPE